MPAHRLAVFSYARHQPLRSPVPSPSIRRGILFHGVPGAGKTLVARALAGECARHSPLPVTFFARKGADCLGKFHGEAERTLRLIFEEVRVREGGFQGEGDA
jgi:ATP-dependent 26S proteasome regulatory subunit